MVVERSTSLTVTLENSVTIFVPDEEDDNVSPLAIAVQEEDEAVSKNEDHEEDEACPKADDKASESPGDEEVAEHERHGDVKVDEKIEDPEDEEDEEEKDGEEEGNELGEEAEELEKLEVHEAEEDGEEADEDEEDEKVEVEKQFEGEKE